MSWKALKFILVVTTEYNLMKYKIMGTRKMVNIFIQRFAYLAVNIRNDAGKFDPLYIKGVNAKTDA